jgi:branched-chain amino acid transport system ATP-binding protein|uniref:ABC transporter ATP-binding protein n=1 Tax=Desulfomonile tiedjei TaxID=2358 RepID=A0A7C4AT79_9BACT
MNQPLLAVSGLSVAFGGLLALNDLDIAIEKGQIVGLIGPNGAGKTTAFNAITGRIKPTAGSVLFKGVDITGWQPSRIAQFGITRTFQSIKLYDDLSVVENVMVAAHATIRYSFLEAMVGVGRYAQDEKRIRKQAHELLDIVGLGDYAMEKAAALPYGSQRRLEVARALALGPSLLLLDEPVAGMNPMETMDFVKVIQRLNEEMGLSIGLIEHDMKFVMNVCHKIRVIDHGIPIAWGAPQEIAANEQVVAAYLGHG